jgi:glycine cleavage system H protein
MFRFSAALRPQARVVFYRGFATKYYTKSDEWVSIEGNNFTLGISEYAQSHLGDCVFVDLPQVGDKRNAGESILTVESTKAVADVYTPFAVTVSATNDKISANSGIINEDAEGAGWLVKGTTTKISTEGEIAVCVVYFNYFCFPVRFDGQGCLRCLLRWQRSLKGQKNVFIAVASF